jgi:hypothetical protein
MMSTSLGGTQAKPNRLNFVAFFVKDKGAPVLIPTN